MSVKLPKEFYKGDLVNPVSAAGITYMLHANAETQLLLYRKLLKMEESQKDFDQRAEIRHLTEPSEFYHWMRQEIGGINKFLLRLVMLDHEDEIKDMVCDKILRCSVDVFVEAAAEFLIDCRWDPSEWIREHYCDIQNPYTRSLICLVLGFRGNEDDIGFLLNETKKFVKEFPDENFEQGPIIAIYRLAGLTSYLNCLE